jgi:hypothetical protein
MAKSKILIVLLHCNWVTIPAGQSAKVGPRGADCIDGMWVKVNIPNKGYVDIGYYSFKFSPMSPCQNTTAVVGVEPIVTNENTQGYATMGTIGMTKTVLKEFKFYVGHIHGDIGNASAETDIKF